MSIIRYFGLKNICAVFISGVVCFGENALYSQIITSTVVMQFMRNRQFIAAYLSCVYNVIFVSLYQKKID